MKLSNLVRYVAVPIAVMLNVFVKVSYGAVFSMQIMTDLNQIQLTLAQLGPLLSAILFIVAGIFYATGQMLSPEKKAQFHTTSINIIIGALVVGALSVASTGLATISTQLLANSIANTVANTP